MVVSETIIKASHHVFHVFTVYMLLLKWIYLWKKGLRPVTDSDCNDMDVQNYSFTNENVMHAVSTWNLQVIFEDNLILENTSQVC